MDKQLSYLIMIYLITGFSMLISIFIIRSYIEPRMGVSFVCDRKYTLFKDFDCHIWCFSHFIMYILLGYYAPNYWYISFTLSIVWEYIELYLNKLGVPIIYNIKNDIITNTTGLVIGMILNKYAD